MNKYYHITINNKYKNELLITRKIVGKDETKDFLSATIFGDYLNNIKLAYSKEPVRNKLGIKIKKEIEVLKPIPIICELTEEEKLIDIITGHTYNIPDFITITKEISLNELVKHLKTLTEEDINRYQENITKLEQLSLNKYNLEQEELLRKQKELEDNQLFISNFKKIYHKP